jgi:hypothetical protein
VKLPRKVSIVEFSQGCRVPHSAGGVSTGLIAEKHKIDLSLNEYGIHAISRDGKFEAFYPHAVLKASILLPDDEPPARVARVATVKQQPGAVA